MPVKLDSYLDDKGASTGFYVHFGIGSCLIYNCLATGIDKISRIMQKINLHQKLSLFSDYWSPHIVGELNSQHVKLAKLKGEFTWHKHDDEDELFLVLKGTLKIEFRDKTVELKENECIIVPRGVEHKPVADEEVHVLLFEPAGTLNTGDVRNEMTKDTLKKI